MTDALGQGIGFIAERMTAPGFAITFNQSLDIGFQEQDLHFHAAVLELT